MNRQIIVLVCALLAVSSCVNGEGLGSEWEGTWTNEDFAVGGFGGAFKICQNQNKIVGTYSGVGYIQGQVDPSTKEASGKWFQVGHAGTMVGSSTAANPVSPAIESRSLPNMGTFKFSLVLDEQGNLIGFAGVKYYDQVPSDVYSELWAATKISMGRPSNSECGFNPSTSTRNTVQGGFLLQGETTPQPLDGKITEVNGIQTIVISWEEDIVSEDENGNVNVTRVQGYEEGRCYLGNTICVTNYYSDNVLEDGEVEQGIALYIVTGDLELVCFWWATSSVADITEDWLPHLLHGTFTYKKTRSTPISPSRNIKAVYPVVFEGEWEDPMYSGGSLFICANADYTDNFGNPLYLEGSLSNVGYIRGYYNNARDVVSGKWVRAGSDAIWNEDLKAFVGNTGDFTLYMNSDLHSFHGNISYDPLPGETEALSHVWTSRRPPGVGPIIPQKLQCMQGGSTSLRNEGDIDGAWDLFQAHTALRTCSDSQSFEASAVLILDSLRTDLYERGQCSFENNVCYGSWWTQNNFGSVIHHVSAQFDHANSKPVLQSSYFTGNSADLLDSWSSQVWNPTLHSLTLDPQFSGDIQPECNDFSYLYRPIVAESSATLLHISSLLLLSLFFICFF